MTYVDTWQMKQIRRQRGESLGQVCRIDRAINTTDTTGGYTQSWPAGDEVRCTFTTPSTSNSRAVGMIPDTSNERAWIVALPFGTEITPADRIICDGDTFEVLGVDRPGTYGIQQTVAVVGR